MKLTTDMVIKITLISFMCITHLMIQHDE